MSPRDATLQAMREVSGVVIGVALVLSAVFIPTAFLPGITGRLVSTVRAHDCDLRHFLRVQRALAKPGACLPAASPAKEGAGPAWLVFRSIQSCLRRGDPRLRELVAHRHSKSGAQLRVARGARGRRGTFWIAIAERFFAGRRPGLHLSCAAITGRGITRANRCRVVAKSKRFLSKTPGVQVHDQRSRIQFAESRAKYL